MIRVGIAGWSYPDWEGTVYPRTKGRGFHPLAYLAPHVDAVEVNSSFYALPDVRHVERWAAIAAPHADLVFTAKLHRDLTHEAWSATRPGTLAALLAALEPLRAAGRLVALLAQFPIGFVHGKDACRHL